MINDGYIHWNLLRHMLKAGLIGEAQKLVTDLRWLAAKLDVTGPADLLNDYLSIKGQVDDKVIYNTVPFGGTVTDKGVGTGCRGRGLFTDQGHYL